MKGLDEKRERGWWWKRERDERESFFFLLQTDFACFKTHFSLLLLSLVVLPRRFFAQRRSPWLSHSLPAPLSRYV